MKKPGCARLPVKRPTGIEPASSAWKAEVIPLYHRRTLRFRMEHINSGKWADGQEPLPNFPFYRQMLGLSTGYIVHYDSLEICTGGTVWVSLDRIGIAVWEEYGLSFYLYGNLTS